MEHHELVDTWWELYSTKFPFFSWNVHFDRNISDRSVSEIETLLLLLVSTNSTNKYRRILNSSGMLSDKSFFSF